MNAAITGVFATTILATTVAASLAIAFGLEWMCLRGVMALMPARAGRQHGNRDFASTAKQN